MTGMEDLVNSSSKKMFMSAREYALHPLSLAILHGNALVRTFCTLKTRIYPLGDYHQGC